MITLKFDLKKFLKNLKLNEDNLSTLFGIFIIVVMGILIVNYFKDRRGEITPAGETKNEISESYEVKKGDTLWKIAELKMGSGFKWQEIKNLNNLKSETIEVGQKLNIPEVSQLQINKKITTDTYTVVKGDTLWDIAVFAYGDGYRWVEIAKINKLVNPGIIHAGNVLKLPR